MNSRKDDFPHDLRGLCGGAIKEPDGTHRFLASPVKAYFNLWNYIADLEQFLEDFHGSNEDKEIHSRLLELAKEDLLNLKQRILDHFNVCPGIAGNPRASETVDHGAKNKVAKALADIEAGIYDPSKKSKTLLAVFRALSFKQKNGRMPTRDELMNEHVKGIKFNAQQVTDAGKWLEQTGSRFPNALFPPLHRSRRGRPLKKK